MRFLVDENLPSDLVVMAEERGFRTAWVRDVLPGAKDALILGRLWQESEILVSRDVRFANLIFNLITAGEDLPGAILIREQRMEAIRKAWQRYLIEAVPFRGITVITQARIRRHKPREE